MKINFLLEITANITQNHEKSDHLYEKILIGLRIVSQCNCS